MRIINWILKALNFLKDSAELIKWIAIAILAISTFTGFKSCKNERQDKDNMKTILNHEVETFKTKSGRNAAESKNWELKYKSLDKFTGEINKENSDLKNEIIEARNTIADAEIREKDVQNYIKNELVRKDSMETNIIFIDDPCKFKIEPIEQEFLKLTFEQNDNFDILNINHEYRNTIYTLLNLYPSRIDNPKRKRNGKKHFPNWAVFWGYDHTTITTVKDEKSKITNVVSIEFTK